MLPVPDTLLAFVLTVFGTNFHCPNPNPFDSVNKCVIDLNERAQIVIEKFCHPGIHGEQIPDDRGLVWMTRGKPADTQTDWVHK